MGRRALLTRLGALRHPVRVIILLWLVPPVLVTVVAMVWVSWIGRDRPVEERSEAARARAQQRFAEAILREPTAPGHVRRTSARDRSTGVVAVRPGRDRRGARDGARDAEVRESRRAG